MLQHGKRCCYTQDPLFTKRLVTATLTWTKVCSDLSPAVPLAASITCGAFMTNRTTALKALTAAGALVVLAACGSSGGSGGTSTNGGSSSSGGSTSAGTPVHGGDLTFAAVQDATS